MTSFPSFFPEISMWCVWTCQDTRGPVAPERRTTSSRVRSSGFTRFAEESVELFKLSGFLNMCLWLCVCVCSLCRALVWIRDPSIWLEDPWVGMSLASMLPLTPHTCPASLWLVQQVEQMSDLCVGFNLRTSTKESVSLHLPGLVYPEETKFISNLRDMEQSKQEQFALIPSSIQELEEMLQLCCYNQPKLPRQVRTPAGFRASATTTVSIHSLHLQ